jgi:hypothetical protein
MILTPIGRSAEPIEAEGLRKESGALVRGGTVDADGLGEAANGEGNENGEGT